uniref:SpoU rRNA Methylase family putative n=1 Tax=Albugo laibachii Nc14 TaxID=890382 RepID=F0WYK6_9STRA|nr:SpoU rRNA Methylase family putative [Albugo laibachii Nc14]|eukprot:CCA26564.1 SpoU rRNA Methylase family putative [Albugo laibachii Nc14]
MTGIARHLDHLYCQLQHRSPLLNDVNVETLITNYRYVAVGAVSTFSISDISTHLKTFDSILLNLNQVVSDGDDQQLLLHLSVLEECVYQAIKQESTLSVDMDSTEHSQWKSVLLPFLCTSMLPIPDYQKYHSILVNILDLILVDPKLDHSLVSLSFSKLITQAKQRIQEGKKRKDILFRLFSRVLLRLYLFLSAESQSGDLAVQLRHQVLDLASSAIENLSSNLEFLQSIITCVFTMWLQGNKDEVHSVLDFFHLMLTRYEHPRKVECIDIEENLASRESPTESIDEQGAHFRMLLEFVWIVIRHQPTLMRNEKIQDVICYGLRSEESLIRKYSHDVLQIAFTSYIGDVSLDSLEASTDKNLRYWNIFFAASQVIQFQQEQHLIEQVWPQVQDLLYSCLFKKEEEPGSQESWPVSLSFKWLQSLFIRTFEHKNPILRRKLLSNFMETGSTALEPAIQCIRNGEATPGNREPALAMDIDLHLFIMTNVLAATNDPSLYKTNPSKTAYLLGIITNFLAKWLSVFCWQNILSTEHANILRNYVFYVYKAIFASSSKRYSQDALLAMLRVFQSSDIKLVVKNSAHLPALASQLLDKRALETLRFMLEVHVLPSFSAETQRGSLLAVQAALTEGLTQSPDEHSLLHISRILVLFPMADLLGSNDEKHAACYLHLHDWLHSSNADAEWFTEAIVKAVENFVYRYYNESDFTTLQLARLMLFTATRCHDEANITTFSLDKPLFRKWRLLSSMDLGNRRLRFSMLEAWEDEVQEMLRCQGQDQYRTTIKISLDPIRIYQQIDQTSDDDASSIDDPFIGCEWVYNSAMESAEVWLNPAFGVAYNPLLDQYCDTFWLNSVARVGTQMAIYLMEARGSMDEFRLISTLALRFSDTLVDPRAQLYNSETVQVYEIQTIAMEFLATVSTMPQTAEMIPLFHASHPFLQSLCETYVVPKDKGHECYGAKSTIYKSYNHALAAFTIARWQIIHTIVTNSTYLSNQLVHQVTKCCIKAFETMGCRSEMLRQITETLICCSKHFKENGIIDDPSNSILVSVWNTYMECKTRTDALTQSVIYFILNHALYHSGDSESFKTWFSTLYEYGENNRPNVIYHLSTHLCRIWQYDLVVASSSVPMILKLLLYREPKEINRFAEIITETKSATNNQFVRLRVLTWLEQLSDAHEITDNLVLLLLMQYVNNPEWRKPQMIHSDIFGCQVRAWQALCVLSRHITTLSLLQQAEDLFYGTIFCLPALNTVRYYFEVFAMRLIERSNILHALPNSLEKHILPLLFNFNQPPQQLTSLLLILGHFVHVHIGKHSHSAMKDPILVSSSAESGSDAPSPNPIQSMPIIEILISGLLCWLNGSHGHVRVIAQYFLRTLLPHYIALVENGEVQNGGHLLEWHFLTETSRFLSENKECMRMHRRQSHQLENIQPGHRCSVQGLLESTYWHVESNDILPKESQFSWTFQIKESVKDIYAQFQLEYKHLPVHQTPVLSKNQITKHEAPSSDKRKTILIDTSISVVQRKIDVGPNWKPFKFDPLLTATSVNDQRHIPSSGTPGDSIYEKSNRVIMCASLIDKVTNLAGLARTCEIFGAEKLVVSNLNTIKNDATFVSMSSSAHKWIKMEQISRGESLIDAIHHWKEVEKYHIIGLEQTSRSQCCSKYRFPDKAVIILGSEGAGIPVEILRLVDVCVEIPQFGLVRSLNVHVSGAILLWEYTRQRLSVDDVGN